MPIPIMVDLFMIGASDECQLKCRVPGFPPRHCALVSRGRKVFVRDMNSGQPTLINGSLLPAGDEWPLHKGDRLELGEHLEFVLQMREKPLSQRDLEEWALGCLDQSGNREYDDPEDIISTLKGERHTTPSRAAAQALDVLSAIRGDVVGRLRIGMEDNVLVVRFNDRFLVEEPEINFISKELHDQLGKPNLRVLLDCKNVKRMSTAAVKMLDDLSKWLAQWGSKMAICRLHADLQVAIKSLGLHKRFPIYSDKQTALQSKW